MQLLQIIVWNTSIVHPHQWVEWCRITQNTERLIWWGKYIPGKDERDFQSFYCEKYKSLLFSVSLSFFFFFNKPLVAFSVIQQQQAAWQSFGEVKQEKKLKRRKNLKEKKNTLKLHFCLIDLYQKCVCMYISMLVIYNILVGCAVIRLLNCHLFLHKLLFNFVVVWFNFEPRTFQVLQKINVS